MLQRFIAEFIADEFIFETIPLTDKSLCPILVVLIVRWVQLRWNTWVRQQQITPTVWYGGAGSRFV